MADIFPSEEELDSICKKQTVPLNSFKADRPLTKRLPNLVTVLLAVDQVAVRTLEEARKKVSPVSEDDLESVENFIRNTCNLPKPKEKKSWFKSTKTRRSAELTVKGYEIWFEYRKRIFDEDCRNSFKKILNKELDGDQLQHTGTELLLLLGTKIKGKTVYTELKKVLYAYNTLKNLPGKWTDLIKIAEAICGKLEELEKSDAKLAGKIQHELDDKLKKLYADKGKGYITLNDVNTVLGEAVINIKILNGENPL